MILTKLNSLKINSEDDRKTQEIISVLRKQFQSSNINIILGAGFSYGVYQLLGDIEKQLYVAEYIEKNKEKVLRLKKRFFKGSILPYLDDKKRRVGMNERNQFIRNLGDIVAHRHSTILHKIVNVYTTNYDLLVEESLENCNLNYTDGFSGRINPIFSTANYGLILHQQTSISSMTSESVTFNLYKVHGSLNWGCDNDRIIYSDPKQKIKMIEDSLKADDFENEYKKLAIINPTKDKLNETVLNVNYYDQLRMFCNELEKNNTILLAFGFSFADEHIQSMTIRALMSNPTLTLIIFSFDEKSTKFYQAIFKDCTNVNIIQLVENDQENNENVVAFSIEKANAVLEAILDGIK